MDPVRQAQILGAFSLAIVDVVAEAQAALLRERGWPAFSESTIAALSIIEDFPGVTMSALTQRVGLQKAAMARIVRLLEKEKIVLRGAAAGVAVERPLTLTVLGGTIGRTLKHTRINAIRSFVGGLPSAELQQAAAFAEICLARHRSKSGCRSCSTRACTDRGGVACPRGQAYVAKAEDHSNRDSSGA